MALSPVTGSVGINAQFTEVVSGGYINPVSLPSAINQSVSYSNGTGAGAVNATYASALAITGGSYSAQINLLSALDLVGASQSFQRVREFIVQNPNSFDVQVWGGSSNGASTSGVTWVGASTNSGSMFVRGYGSATNSQGGILRISDPNLTTSLLGNIVSTASCLVAFSAAASCSINVMAMGCTSFL